MPDPFHVRFNIEVPIEEVRRRFINRIETKIRDAVEAAHADSGSSRSALDFLLTETQIALGEPHREYLCYSEEFMVAWRILVKQDFSQLSCCRGRL